jgi:exosortase/archaeosortase family protein
MRTESYEELIGRWSAETRADRWNSVRMLFIFVAVFIALQSGWEASRGTALERLLIDKVTVIPAARTIDSLWPNDGVRAHANSLVSTTGRINVLNGCEGLELVFLLIAAFAAYPLPWRRRILGMAMGIAVAYIANQGRLVALWYAYVHDRQLFGVLHGTLTPLILVGFCLLFFMIFTGRDVARDD